MKGKKRTEILGCFWDEIVVELKDDPARWETCDRDIKVGDLSLSRCFAHFQAELRSPYGIASKIRSAHMTSIPTFPHTFENEFVVILSVQYVYDRTMGLNTTVA